MAKEPNRPPSPQGKTLLEVSTGSRPEFKEPLVAYAFDRAGNLLAHSAVKAGKLTLPLEEGDVARAHLFLVPGSERLEETDLTPSRMEKLGAFRAVLPRGKEGELPKLIEIPGPVLDLWPFCFCLVRGRVVRSSDGRPVCNARVHVCEVDRIPWLIARLPDPDILRLRDDLLDALERPPIPFPPDPLPIPPEPFPGPDPVPFARPLIRVGDEWEAAGAAQRRRVPAALRSAARVPATQERAVFASSMEPEMRTRLLSASTPLVRQALIENWKLILPYLCLWPRWWRFRCDEVAVVNTDANGRFQTIIPYPCSGDHPDLYFWVEFDFGNGYQTVYRPPIACWTHWNYPCGSEVTLHVADPRVPSCHGEGSPPGKQVWVMSVGRTVAIGEIHTNAAGPLEGMVREPFAGGEEDFAFGGKLEPRVWFGRKDLIDAGITHYLWSVRPLGGSEADWAPLHRQVIRHYTTAGGSAPVDVMGPEAGGANAGRFRIRPVNPPAGGIEWVVADEREDLASAHLETSTPASPNPFPACGVEDLDAGKYELKMELFRSSGAKVVWDDEGIVLRVATGEAPFGTDPVTTVVAGDYHRIKNAGGKTLAFRMVLHVNNSRCGASIDAIAGAGITVDPACGVVTLVGSSPTLDVGFHAGRPGGLARFHFDLERGLSTDISQASAAGGVGDASVNGFTRTLPCHFTKGGLAASAFLDSCSQAAFSEHLRVWALTQDGYHRLSGLDAYDVAAFMLAEPCAPCPPCEEGNPGQGQAQGGGQGRGRGQGGG